MSATPPPSSRGHHQVFSGTSNSCCHPAICQHNKRVAYRAMEHSSYDTPDSHNDDCHCPIAQNRTCPASHLTARGTSRTRPNHRANSVHLTKTGTLRPPPSTPASGPNNTGPPRSYFHTSWRMRRSKSNPAPQDSGLFVHCPFRLNNPHCSVFPISDPPGAKHIPRNDLSCFHYP